MPFERPDHDPSRAGTEVAPPPETFDFLGFTHVWSRSRTGNFVVKRKTSRSRFSRGLRTISDWCRVNRHLPISEQHHTLSQKLRGHFAYYGITGNSVALSRFRWHVIDIGRRWLSRQRRDGTVAWGKFSRLLTRYPLPPHVAIHSVLRRVASS